jgi:hypothetical protein
MAEAGHRTFRQAMRFGAILLLLSASGCGGPSPDNRSEDNAANVAIPAQAAAAPAPVDDGRCPAPLTWGALRTGGQSKIDPVKNVLSLDDDGRFYWNRVPIDAVRMRQYLEITQTMNPVPLLIVEPDPKTPCDRISRLVALVGGIANCARDCTYREKAFDSKMALPEPPPQETRLMAAMNPSSLDDGDESGGCGGGRTSLTLDSEGTWSPWIDVAPGCVLTVVYAPGVAVPADSESPYLRQCRWREGLADDCQTADAVRFARNIRTTPDGSTVALTLEIARP